MSDWKGIAMVVNQLAQLAEPGKLDLLEREYEMKAVENEADRQHTFLLKAYETKEDQLSKLQTQYETILKEGEALYPLLPDEYKDPSNYSGNTDKILNDVYGGRFTNYQAGIKGLQSEIDKLESSIINMNAINDAAELGKRFTKNWKTSEDDFDYFKEHAASELSELTNTDKYINASDEERANMESTLRSTDARLSNLSYDESEAAIEDYINWNFDEDGQDGDTANAFRMGARQSLDREKRAKDTAAVETRLTKSEDKLTSAEKASKRVDDVAFQLTTFESDKMQKILTTSSELNFLTAVGEEYKALKLHRDHVAAVKDAIGIDRSHELMTLGDDYPFEYMSRDANDKIIYEKDAKGKDTEVPVMIDMPSAAKGLNKELYEKILAGLSDPKTYAQAHADKGLFHQLYFKHDFMMQDTATRGMFDNSVAILRSEYGL